MKDGQKCPFKDSHVAVIMLTTPCSISGAHPSLTLLAKILLPVVSTLACGLRYSTLRRKMLCVHLVPLNVGMTASSQN
jgi:hypothetical protein